ncbi:hypothetical protein NQ176_g7522 [Zarea fungicola]|uniref:Uncharacterized protein n=1 Tax=Zarea fungicola TaxID=93591 RepID=A0ACC1MXQ5_9HYPO|nr:hypothetical protein NQ176_g7522 [Lecanicillium fungicola]
MVLQANGSTQTEAMSFFQHICLHNLSQYQPGDSWQQTLMFFAQTVPPVRHAAIALSLMHRACLYRESRRNLHQPPPTHDEFSETAALLHYNRAIQLVLSQETRDGSNTEAKAVTLLVCHLFTCFDHLAGNSARAILHLRGGVELTRTINRTALDSDAGINDARPAGIDTLIGQVTRQIRRLDLQAATFLLHWTPVDLQETFVPQLPSLCSGGFMSLDHAADHLQQLIAGAIMLRNASQKLHPASRVMPSSSSTLKESITGNLGKWSTLFENLLSRRGSTYQADTKARRLISLLRLQHGISWIMVNSLGPGKEMEFDGLLPCFQECILLADQVASEHDGPLQSNFTPELGVVPALYVIGSKCRHPVVRRQALRILRRQTVREALWHSAVAARIVERVIEIEESGSGQGAAVYSMEQVPLCRRVEDLTFFQCQRSPATAKLNIQYTLCGQDGAHTESLVEKEAANG